MPKLQQIQHVDYDNNNINKKIKITMTKNICDFDLECIKTEHSRWGMTLRILYCQKGRISNKIYEFDNDFFLARNIKKQPISNELIGNETT